MTTMDFTSVTGAYILKHNNYQVYGSVIGLHYLICFLCAYLVFNSSCGDIFAPDMHNLANGCVKFVWTWGCTHLKSSWKQGYGSYSKFLDSFFKLLVLNSRFCPKLSKTGTPLILCLC